MIEFFNNIWNWIITNRITITTFVTSGTFMTTVAAVFTIVKNISSTRKNTLSINSINDTISNTNSISENVSEVKKSNLKTSEGVQMCNEKVDELCFKMEEFQTNVLAKMNSLFDLYSVVYSTIKDDTIRNTVNSILIKAKHNDDVSKAELEKEIEELKLKVAEKVKDVNATVNEVVDKVKNSMTHTVEIAEEENMPKRY